MPPSVHRPGQDALDHDALRAHRNGELERRYGRHGRTPHKVEEAGDRMLLRWKRDDCTLRYSLRDREVLRKG
jgi:hypothetical protein